MIYRFVAIVFIVGFWQPTFSQYDVDADIVKAAQFYSEGQYDSACLYYDAVGRFYRAEAEYELAYKYFQNSMKIRDSIGSPEVALSYLYMSTIHGYRYDDSLAIAYETMAYDVASKSGNELYQIYALGNLGNTLATMIESDTTYRYLLDSAQRSLDKAERIARRNIMEENPKIPRGILNYLDINNGHLAVQQKDYQKAYNYNRRVLSYFEENGYPDKDYAIVLNNLGYESLLLGNLDSAMYFLSKGRKFTYERGLPQHRLDILDNLIEIYSYHIQNLDSVVSLTAELGDLEELLYGEESARMISQLRVQYGAERLERENAEQQVTIQRAEQQRLIYIILILSLGVLGLVGYALIKRKMMQREKEFARINELLKDQEIEAFNSVLEAQEKERKRIASELHDKIGSTLSAAKLYLHHLEEAEEIIPFEKDYSKGMSLLDDAVADVRSVSHAMATGVLGQFGLVPALNDLQETINGTRKIHLKLHVHGLDHRLPQQTELHIYRVIQELVSNAMKHSGAKEIVVQLTQHDEELNILVEDNGSGFDVHASGGGIGLKNIESRVSFLGASMNIDSYRGRGTTVSIDVPVAQG